MKPLTDTLSCFKCDKPLEAIFDDTNQPLKGLCFQSRGHYGTAVFDPLDGSWIEINICDDCLREGVEKQNILHYENKCNIDKFKG